MVFGVEFLFEPDLFPARIAGEPWGAERLVLDLPAGPYLMEGLTFEQLAAIRRAWDIPDGQETPAGASVRVRVFRAAASDFREFPLAGWETRFDLESSPTGVRLAGRRFLAVLSFEEGWMEDFPPEIAIWTAASDPLEWVGVAENILRVAVAYRVLALGGVLIHAAAVVPRSGTTPGTSSGARLFAGVSGAGKSTAARLSVLRGHAVLSDDLNALLPGPSGFEVRWVPFGGDFRGQRPVAALLPSVPIIGVHLLEKSSQPYRASVSASEAVGKLLGVTPFVNVDSYRLPKLLEVLEHLVATVSVERLGFGLDPVFWDILSEEAALR